MIKLETFELKYTDVNGAVNTLTISKDMFTWMELIREFHRFLKGCGYIFDNNKVFVLKKGEYDYD